MATTISSLTPTTGTTSTTDSSSSDSDSISSILSSANTGTISSLGVGSGLNLSGLLTQLVNAEKAPQQALIDQQTQTVNTEISALGSVQSKLVAFQNSLAALKDATDFTNKTATSSDTSVLSATAVNTAQTGSYNISVSAAAQANKLASATFASQSTVVGDGTLTIGIGSNTFNVTINSSNDTVSGIQDAINSASNNTGVQASLLGVSNGSGGTAYKLVLTSTNTGAANQISVNVADSDGTNTNNTGLSQLYYSVSDPASQLTQVNAAQDASITVDGFAATSSTNTFSSTIPGVTFTVLNGPSSPSTPLTTQLTIGTDTTTTTNAVGNFVKAYNDLITTLNSVAGYNATTQTAGPLFGDSNVSLIQSQIQKVLGSPVSGAASDLNTLSLIGITTNADGTLSLNTSQFASATNGRFSDLGKLFSGTNGVAGQLDNLITQFTTTGGALALDQQSLSDQLTSLKQQQTDLNTRIADFQSRTQAQFAALDQIVQQLNQTSSFLTQQFNAINGSGSSKSGG